MAECPTFYDILIVAPHSVRHWANHALLSFFENQNFTCCVEERDFSVGSSLPDEWCEKIRNSRKVVLLLTEDFKREPWKILAEQIAFAMQVEEDMPLHPKVIPVKLHTNAYVPEHIALTREILDVTSECQQKYWQQRLKRAVSESIAGECANRTEANDGANISIFSQGQSRRRHETGRSLSSERSTELKHPAEVIPENPYEPTLQAENRHQPEYGFQELMFILAVLGVFFYGMFTKPT